MNLGWCPSCIMDREVTLGKLLNLSVPLKPKAPFVRKRDTYITNTSIYTKWWGRVTGNTDPMFIWLTVR